MIKIFSIILLLSSLVFSQGFSWKRSSRVPFEIPKTYIGVNLSLSNANYLGNTKLIENGILCCEFEDGISSDVTLGLSSEYWFLPDLSFGLNASLNFSNPNYNRRRSIPYYSGDSVIISHDLEKSIANFIISPSAKYRIYDKLNLGMRLNLFFNVSSSAKSFQTVLAPDEYLFRNGTKIFESENPSVSELKSIVIQPEVFVSYDLQLLYPVYISPFVSADFSLNRANEDGTRIFRFSFGFNLFYGYQNSEE